MRDLLSSTSSSHSADYRAGVVFAPSNPSFAPDSSCQMPQAEPRAASRDSVGMLATRLLFG